MKKLLYAFPIVVLLAAGCNNASQQSVQGLNQNVSGQTVQANSQSSLNTAPSSCNDVVSLQQLQAIVGGNNLMLNSSSSDPGPLKDHVVTCMYANYSLSNPAAAPSRIIGVNFSIYNYSDSSWQSSQIGIPGAAAVSGLGSKALRYIYNAQSNSPGYWVTSSNGKYIISISENDVTNNSPGSIPPNTTENVGQEDQAEVSIIKAIDANLNNY